MRKKILAKVQVSADDFDVSSRLFRNCKYPSTACLLIQANLSRPAVFGFVISADLCLWIGLWTEREIQQSHNVIFRSCF